MNMKMIFKKHIEPFVRRTFNIYGVLVILTLLFALIIWSVQIDTTSPLALPEKRSPTGSIENYK